MKLGKQSGAHLFGGKDARFCNFHKFVGMTLKVV
jgi:hypothetical protein